MTKYHSNMIHKLVGSTQATWIHVFMTSTKMQHFIPITIIRVGAVSVNFSYEGKFHKWAENFYMCMYDECLANLQWDKFLQYS